jgi:hypothetical protein
MRTLQVHHLKPCDVLLYHGTTFPSKLIMLFDGGSYSHAALYDGERVVEVIATGVARRSLQESVGDAKHVDVYRFQKDGRELGEPGWPAGPVLAAARQLGAQGERYAYEQILLLVALCATRRAPGPGLMKRFLRILLDAPGALLAKVTGLGKEPMICSELVYRCFDQADAQGKYALGIRGASLAARLAARRPRARARAARRAPNPSEPEPAVRGWRPPGRSHQTSSHLGTSKAPKICGRSGG